MYIKLLTATFLFIFVVTTAISQDLLGLLPSPDGGGLLFSFPFDMGCDADADGWPDGWSRMSGVDSGINFSQNIQIEIRENATPFGRNSLHVPLSGGGVAIFSPHIPVRRGLTYSASIYLNSTGLRYNNVSMNISFFSANGERPLRTWISEKVTNTNGWKQLRILQAVASMPDVAYAVVGLIILPTSRQDFSGEVDFVRLQVFEEPTVNFSTNNDDHIFRSPSGIDVHCELIGVASSMKSVTFALEDTYGKQIAQRKADFPTAPTMVSRKQVNDSLPTAGASVNVVWTNLPIIKPGFYRVRLINDNGTKGSPVTSDKTESLIKTVSTISDDTTSPVSSTSPPHPSLTGNVDNSDYSPLTDAKPLTLVYLEPSIPPVGGEFGWSMQGFTLPELLKKQALLGDAGISRVKLPTWLPSKTTPADWHTLKDFCLWLTRRRIRMTGLLEAPPEITDKIRTGGKDVAAVFSQPQELWFPTLETMLTQLSLLIREWQIGTDEDRSVRELPAMYETLDLVRKLFNTAAYDVTLGFGWDWTWQLPPTFKLNEPDKPEPVLPSPPSPDVVAMNPLVQTPPIPSAIPESREFVNLGSNLTPTSQELAYELRRSEGTGVLRYISIVPLSRLNYRVEDRIRDLVQRMIVAKINRADAVFIPKPFDDDNGLMNADGTPGELFLAWRTTSQLLNAKRWAGSIKLPNRSTNVIFQGAGNTAVMVLWNDSATIDKPIDETLYLGTNVEMVDLNGAKSKLPLTGRQHTVSVGPVPVFVTGIDMDVTKWRQRFQLKNHVLPSYVGKPNANEWTFVNDTPNVFAGELTFVAPEENGWRFSPHKERFTTSLNESVTKPFTITLAPEASSGRHPFQIDVRRDTEETVMFSIYDELDIGGGDLSMTFMTRMNRRGELELHQLFTNDGDTSVSYDITVYPPKRPTLTSRVNKLSNGQVKQVYVLKDGKELLGKTIRIVAKPTGADAAQQDQLRYHVKVPKGD